MLLNKEILIGIYDYISISNLIWTGLGSDNNWSTSSNWDIRFPKSYDILQFAGTTRLTPFNDLIIDTPFDGIAFNARAGAFTLNGNRFVLNSGSISNSSTNIQTVNNDIILGSNAKTVNCATSPIVLRGDISGSGSLTKLGASTLSLSGNNSYTGNTVINSGTINVLNSNPFGTGIVNCPNNGTSSNGFINIPSTATPANTIINNPIIINGSTSQSFFNIVANKSATLNGLLACGPDNIQQLININNNATLTFNGGISGISGWNNSFGLLGNGTYVISSPVIFNASSILTPNSNTVTLILSSIDNKFNMLRIIAGTVRTDVSFAINDEVIRIGNDLLPSAANKIPLLNLNGTDQIIRNIQNNSTNFVSCATTNIFNNSSTFANLSLNNTGGSSTYTGSISGNINLTKIGSLTLTLSGSTDLGVGPRYTGFTAISAGTLINYALFSNPSNKVSFVTFTPTTLSATFITSPVIGEVFKVFGGSTINSYPLVSLTNASGLTSQYINSTSTLEILGPYRWSGSGTNNNWSTVNNWNLNRAPLNIDNLTFFGSTRTSPFNDMTVNSPFSGITFAGGTGTFTLSGNSFATTSDIINNSSNTQTINNDIILSASNINVNCNTSNIVLNGSISGSGTLTKIGSATLTLSGNNSYNGNTYISAGIIDVLNSNPFGTGTVYLSSRSGALSVSINSAPANTIISNPIFINGQRPSSGPSIQANKSATFNGLITVGPLSSTTNKLNVQNGAIMTINGGVSGLPTMNSVVVMNGEGTYILSSVPIIFDNVGATPIYCDTGNETVIIAVSGNKFQNIRPSNLRTDVPFAINNDSVILGTSNRPARVNLNGNDQIFKNIQTASQSSTLSQISANNIFNNSSTFANLTANNISHTTYTGSISGNINLIKIGSSTLTLSGSTALGVGPRYTGFTAISAGTLINYALSSNPSDKVNFAQFTNTALTVNFTTPPTIGDSFILLPARTVNSYPSVSLVNAASRSGAYNSSTSTLSITS